MQITNNHSNFIRTGCFDHLATISEAPVAKDSLEVNSEKAQDALLSGNELKEAAAKWVSKNSDWDEAGDDLFPHPESGNSGTEAYLLEGAAAQRAIDFTKAISMDKSIDFNPATDAVVAVSTTEDEDDLFVNIVDRQDGSVENIADGNLGVTDYEEWVSEDNFASIFPPQQFPELAFGEVSSYEVIDALTDGSPMLSLQEGAG